MNIMNEKIKIMQNNLVHIRKSIGLSAGEFGDYIGVTRQTIYNIETGRTKLTKVQYLAILYALDNYILPSLSSSEKDLIMKLLSAEVSESKYIDSLHFK